MFQVKSLQPGNREVLFSGSFDECKSFSNCHKSNYGQLSCTIDHSSSDEPQPTLGELLGQSAIEIGQELLNESYGSPVRVFAALVGRVIRGLPESLREEFCSEIAEFDPVGERIAAEAV